MNNRAAWNPDDGFDIDTQLSDAKLHELFGDGWCPWADDDEGHNLKLMWKVITGEQESAFIKVKNEFHPDEIQAKGHFTKYDFRQGIIRRAVQIWLQEHADAIEIDAAIQLAVFDDIIYG